MWTIRATADALVLSNGGVELMFHLIPGSLRAMHDMLLQAQMAPTPKIAIAGFPTQSQLNDILRKWKDDNPSPEDQYGFSIKDIL